MKALYVTCTNIIPPCQVLHPLLSALVVFCLLFVLVRCKFIVVLALQACCFCRLCNPVSPQDVLLIRLVVSSMMLHCKHTHRQ